MWKSFVCFVFIVFYSYALLVYCYYFFSCSKSAWPPPLKLQCCMLFHTQNRLLITARMHACAHMHICHMCTCMHALEQMQGIIMLVSMDIARGESTVRKKCYMHIGILRCLTVVWNKIMAWQQTHAGLGRWSWLCDVTNNQLTCCWPHSFLLFACEGMVPHSLLFYLLFITSILTLCKVYWQLVLVHCHTSHHRIL